jgi:hypothetical protein
VASERSQRQYRHDPERELKIALVFRTSTGRVATLAVVRGMAATIIATAGLALLAAGCGGATAGDVAQLGSAASTTQSSIGPTATSKYATSLAYSRCMRSHGVSSFPDPTQVGGGIQISGSPADMNPQSRVFMSAQESCRHLLPDGGQPSHADQRKALARMLRSSQCMRAAGVSGFPDPTLSPPSDRAGYSAIMSNDGVWLAIPNSIDVLSSAFQHAAATCNLEQS